MSKVFMKPGSRCWHVIHVFMSFYGVLYGIIMFKVVSIVTLFNYQGRAKLLLGDIISAPCTLRGPTYKVAPLHALWGKCLFLWKWVMLLKEGGSVRPQTEQACGWHAWFHGTHDWHGSSKLMNNSFNFIPRGKPRVIVTGNQGHGTLSCYGIV